MRRITITINYKSGSLPSFRHDYSYCEIQGRIHCLFQYWTDSLSNFFYYSDQRCLTLCMCEVVNLKWKNLIAFLWDLLCLLWLLLFPAYLRPWEHYAVHWSFVGCWMLHGKARNRSVPYHMIFPLGLKYYENLGSHSPGSSQGQPAMPSQPWFFSKQHRCRYPLSGQYSSRNFFLYFFLLCDVVRTPLLASLLAYFSLSK